MHLNKYYLSYIGALSGLNRLRDKGIGPPVSKRFFLGNIYINPLGLLFFLPQPLDSTIFRIYPKHTILSIQLKLPRNNPIITSGLSRYQSPIMANDTIDQNIKLIKKKHQERRVSIIPDDAKFRTNNLAETAWDITTIAELKS